MAFTVFVTNKLKTHELRVCVNRDGKEDCREIISRAYGGKPIPVRFYKPGDKAIIRPVGRGSMEAPWWTHVWGSHVAPGNFSFRPCSNGNNQPPVNDQYEGHPSIRVDFSLGAPDWEITLKNPSAGQGGVIPLQTTNVTIGGG